MTDDTWSIDAAREAFTEIRKHPAFRAVIRLGRAGNAVAFCHRLLLQEHSEDTPAVQRERLNALLYVAAVLFEGIEAAKKLSKDLKDFEAFQQHFVPLFRDADVQELLTGALKPIRNQGVFHFSDEAIPEQLDAMDSDEVTLLIGKGHRSGDTYFALADVALLNGALGVEGDLEGVYAQLRPLLKRIADLSARFAEGVDHLVSEVVDSIGGYPLNGDPYARTSG